MSDSRERMITRGIAVAAGAIALVALVALI